MVARWGSSDWGAVTHVLLPSDGLPNAVCLAFDITSALGHGATMTVASEAESG